MRKSVNGKINSLLIKRCIIIGKKGFLMAVVSPFLFGLVDEIGGFIETAEPGKSKWVI
jgi:hypothetical protein